MNKFLTIAISLLVISGMFGACTSKGNKTPITKLTTFEDSVAYALGYYIAYNNNDQEWDAVNTDVMARAMEAYYRDGDSSMIFDRKEAINLLNENGRRALEKKRTANSEKAEAFLNANKTKEGVITTESGLQYKILKDGTGAQPNPTDTVMVHYTGTFIDGEVFDDSREGGEPIELDLQQVIRGWKEALPMMKVGSRWQLVVPPKLAYGINGGQGIPPASALVFDIELVEILKNAQKEEVDNSNE
jgi:FKBP-type peptidyl-prolyl cis-trans isomerase